MVGSRAPDDTGQVNASGASNGETQNQAPPVHSDVFNADYIRRLIEHDVSVEHHFVTYFGDLLAMKLRGRVRSADTLNEVRQETFFRVLQALRKGELKQPERLDAYVNAVCNNVLLERFRDDGRHLQLEENSERWSDNRIDLDAPLVSQERRRLVESILAELSDRDRQLLRMILFEGVDKSEACKRLDVNEDYFRVVRHRAVQRFREKLEKGTTPATRIQKLWVSVKRFPYPIHNTVRCPDGT
jgi:RNA polymerase sigma-70 factor, ECF subfamily